MRYVFLLRLSLVPSGMDINEICFFAQIELGATWNGH